MPTGWETDEEEAERNADPITDGDMRRWSGGGRHARLEGKLEGTERGLLREALTAWPGFAGFRARETGLEAEKLPSALGSPLPKGWETFKGRARATGWSRARKAWRGARPP